MTSCNDKHKKKRSRVYGVLKKKKTEDMNDLNLDALDDPHNT